MDFTLKTYRTLLQAFLDKGYAVQPFADFLANPDNGKLVVLRHDVDRKPQNALATAKVEHELGIMASYYFRAVPESWDDALILEIAGLGHEIGYHYESLTTCRGDVDTAYEDFVKHLGELNALLSSSSLSNRCGSCRTICMHGSPKSKWDSRDIWRKYSYKELGILGEPYLDMDFSKAFYLTDTGRCWDGFKMSVRDKIPGFQDKWERDGLVFHVSDDVLEAVRSATFPELVMITTHPQRWTDSKTAWFKELLSQKMKNMVKRVVVTFWK